jgi:hypothetical protein
VPSLGAADVNLAFPYGRMLQCRSTRPTLDNLSSDVGAKRLDVARSDMRSCRYGRRLDDGYSRHSRHG